MSGAKLDLFGEVETFGAARVDAHFTPPENSSEGSSGGKIFNFDNKPYNLFIHEQGKSEWMGGRYIRIEPNSSVEAFRIGFPEDVEIHLDLGLQKVVVPKDSKSDIYVVIEHHKLSLVKGTNQPSPNPKNAEKSNLPDWMEFTNDLAGPNDRFQVNTMPADFYELCHLALGDKTEDFEARLYQMTSSYEPKDQMRFLVSSVKSNFSSPPTREAPLIDYCLTNFNQMPALSFIRLAYEINSVVIAAATRNPTEEWKQCAEETRRLFSRLMYRIYHVWGTRHAEGVVGLHLLSALQKMMLDICGSDWKRGLSEVGALGMMVQNMESHGRIFTAGDKTVETLLKVPVVAIWATKYLVSSTGIPFAGNDMIPCYYLSSQALAHLQPGQLLLQAIRSCNWNAVCVLRQYDRIEYHKPYFTFDELRAAFDEIETEIDFFRVWQAYCGSKRDALLARNLCNPRKARTRRPKALPANVVSLWNLPTFPGATGLHRYQEAMKNLDLEMSEAAARAETLLVNSTNDLTVKEAFLALLHPLQTAESKWKDLVLVAANRAAGRVIQPIPPVSSKYDNTNLSMDLTFAHEEMYLEPDKIPPPLNPPSNGWWESLIRVILLGDQQEFDSLTGEYVRERPYDIARWRTYVQPLSDHPLPPFLIDVACCSPNGHIIAFQLVLTLYLEHMRLTSLLKAARRDNTLESRAEDIEVERATLEKYYKYTAMRMWRLLGTRECWAAGYLLLSPFGFMTCDETFKIQNMNMYNSSLDCDYEFGVIHRLIKNFQLNDPHLKSATSDIPVLKIPMFAELFAAKTCLPSMPTLGWRLPVNFSLLLPLLKDADLSKYVDVKNLLRSVFAVNPTDQRIWQLQETLRRSTLTSDLSSALNSIFPGHSFDNLLGFLDEISESDKLQAAQREIERYSGGAIFRKRTSPNAASRPFDIASFAGGCEFLGFEHYSIREKRLRDLPMSSALHPRHEFIDTIFSFTLWPVQQFYDQQSKSQLEILKNVWQRQDELMFWCYKTKKQVPAQRQGAHHDLNNAPRSTNNSTFWPLKAATADVLVPGIIPAEYVLAKSHKALDPTVTSVVNQEVPLCLQRFVPDNPTY